MSSRSVAPYLNVFHMWLDSTGFFFFPSFCGQQSFFFCYQQFPSDFTSCLQCHRAFITLISISLSPLLSALCSLHVSMSHLTSLSFRF
ncbi:hypothetical protein CPB84DRAFT_263225 [Gymnopilus junonius]|uniref:Uncharacterized protein n=1 Tax=Gymnopilus junonius TaxID=109634 RepID=A0A9P5TH63_GYMJU|nr:hypothetical protein CPB84DRAFT_263225 [Gymnopilus junonius]